MLDFQKLDPFWNLWSKPNPGISSKMLYPTWLNRNLERKIGLEIFVKIEKTDYLSNQLTYAHSFSLLKIGLLSNFSFFGFPKCFKSLGVLL